MAALTFIDATPTFERRGDNMVLTLKSNGVKQAFLFPMSEFNLLVAGGMSAIRNWQEDMRRRPVTGEIIAFPKKRRTKRGRAMA